MMQNNEVVSTLNSLIETCRDGEKGFKEAADGLQSPEIKSRFLEYARERAQMTTELQAEVRRLGGEPETSASMSGAVHRGWFNLKSAITGGDDHAIVAEAERGEDVAKTAYETALKETLPASVKTLLQQQSEKVRRAHDAVRDIRDRQTVSK